MNTLLFLFLYFCFGLGGQILRKFNSNNIANNEKRGYLLFITINGLVSCIFFFVSSKFSISLTLPTLIFSLIYTIVIVISIISSFKVLHYAEISNVNISSNALSLMLTSPIGFLLFQEIITATKLIKIIIMLLALVFVFAERRTDSKPNIKFIPILIFIVFAEISNSILLKLYSKTPNVANENSFFFFSNFILFFISLVAYLVVKNDKKSDQKSIKPLKNPLYILSFMGNTICSNINSLISIYLISIIDISVYTPTISALGIILGVCASLIFKEKIGLFSYIAAVLSILAMII